MSTRKLAHQTVAAAKLAGMVAAYDFAPGQRVQTIDGPGVVTGVDPGPYPSTESYLVTLDHHLGGGNYSLRQLSVLKDTTAAVTTGSIPVEANFPVEAITDHVASQDYPELAEILTERPPIERLQHTAAGPNWWSFQPGQRVLADGNPGYVLRMVNPAPQQALGALQLYDVVLDYGRGSAVFSQAQLQHTAAMQRDEHDAQADYQFGREHGLVGAPGNVPLIQRRIDKGRDLDGFDHDYMRGHADGTAERAQRVQQRAETGGYECTECAGSGMGVWRNGSSCPACHGTGSISAEEGNQTDVLHHLTDDPHFTPDPHHVPEDNAVAVSGRSRPGLFAAHPDQVDTWVHGHGYDRPYIAEIHVPRHAHEPGRWGGERFIPAEHLDKAVVTRVMPRGEQHTANRERPDVPVPMDPPDACSYCGCRAFGDPEDAGRSVRAICQQCGGAMRSWGAQWEPEFPGSPQNHPSAAGDPRAKVNTDVGTIYGPPTAMGVQPQRVTAAMHFEAAWRDVQAKAVRIRKEGGVRIVAADDYGVTGEIRGDTATYESQVYYVPGTRKTAYWVCGCKWGAYSWGRSPAYARFEGRPCSHVLALRFEAQAQGMFGREVGVDPARLEGQHPHSPITVQYQRPTERHPGGDINRRTTPPGNMRTTWQGDSRVRVKGSLDEESLVRESSMQHWARGSRYERWSKDSMLAGWYLPDYSRKRNPDHMLCHACAANRYAAGDKRHTDWIPVLPRQVKPGEGCNDCGAQLSAERRPAGFGEDEGEQDQAVTASAMTPEQAREKRHRHHDAEDARKHAPNFGYGIGWGMGPLLWCDQCNGSGCGHCGGTGQVVAPGGSPTGGPGVGDASTTSSPVANQGSESNASFGDDGGSMAGGASAALHTAMPWHQQAPGETPQAMKVKSVRDAGFKGYVGNSEDWGESGEHDGSDFDEDAWDHTTPEPTHEEQAHYDEHDEYPDSHHERHEQAYQDHMDAKRSEDDSDHEDDHLHHFVREHGTDEHEWTRHETQPQLIDLRQGVYATQTHVSQKHIDKYLADPDAQTHRHNPNRPGGAYLGDEHPMFVTHNGDLHATEGHHRIAAALQRGDTHMMGWHYNLDAHPVAQGYDQHENPGDCYDCKWHTDNDPHYASLRTATEASLHTADLAAGDMMGAPGYTQLYRTRTPHTYSDNPASTGWATSEDPNAWEKPIPSMGFGSLGSLGAQEGMREMVAAMHRTATEPLVPTHAGVALKAADTGRVLMIQRSLEDEKDPARGTWEFPGGGIEDGDKSSFHAAVREFEEETGHPFPEGGHLSHVHRSGNYILHTVNVPGEDCLDFSNGRATVNPDDPDGDHHEQSAWWDPDHAKKNPALREECKSSPWSEIKKAASVTSVTSVRGNRPEATYKPSDSATTTTAAREDHPSHLRGKWDAGYYHGLGGKNEIYEQGVQDRDEYGMSPKPMLKAYLDGHEHGQFAALDMHQPDASWLLDQQEQGPSKYSTLHEEPEAALPSTDSSSTDVDNELSETEKIARTIAAFQQTPGGLAIRASLVKAGAKDFSFAEQQEIIHEGAGSKIRARNFGALDIAGTHYALLGEDETEDDPWLTM